MKTDCSCVSNRLGRMAPVYRRILPVAIGLACGLFGAVAVRADTPLLCVLVPHFKDEYWLSVAYGLEQRAADSGLALRFFEAGGYDALDQQIGQLSACAELQADVILIGTVSSEAPGLLAAVARAASERPVIGLVNELHSPALTARVGVDWEDMGFALGGRLAARFPASGPAQRAIFLTGPASAGWVGPLEKGLRRGLSGSAITITGVYGDDTGTSEQLRLLETAWAQHPDTTLVIGSAPAIEAAMAFFRGQEPRPLLAATYFSHSVARGLAGRQILAAPFDDPIAQGRLAIDAAVAAMAGGQGPRQLSTVITVQDEGIDPAAVTLSPADYFPSLD